MRGLQEFIWAAGLGAFVLGIIGGVIDKSFSSIVLGAGVFILSIGVINLVDIAKNTDELLKLHKKEIEPEP